MIREEVSQASGLPPSATQAIKAMKPLSKEKEPNGPQDWRLRRVEAYQALVQAGAPGRDREEPSWTVLGRFLEEEYFVAAFERAWFVRKVLGISAGDQVEFFLPLLPDHPCRGFFELCAMDSGEEDTKKMTKLIGNVAVPDPDVQMSPVFRYVRRVEEEEDKRQAAADQKKSSESSMHDRQKAASDHVCRDILYAMDSSDENQVLSRARTLLKVSPHHPVAAAKIIRYDWKSAEPELGEWGKEFGNQPAFVREVARHYQDEGPPDLAEKHLKKLIELTPEVTHYRALAAVYKQLNETDKYVNTLEDALKVPELGLNQSRVRAQLADHYMDQGDYETALPYAQAAAESGAGDCLICLSRCYEGMGNMKLAERWIRECSEHYRMSGYRWFFWCKRTGFGNVEAARQLAEDCLVPRDRGHSGEGETYGAYLVLAGEPRQAAEMFQKDFELNWNPNSGLHGAVLAFKMGDRKLCGELLQKILDKSTESKSLAERRRPKIELARLLQEATRPGGTLDARQVDAILEQAPESELVNVQYFAGRFFEALGDESHAREYLLRAARDKQTDKFTHVLACDRCRQLGLEIATQPASRP